MRIATWTTCFGCSAQCQLVDSGEAIGLRIAVLSREQVLQGARSGASVASIDDHAQIFGDNGRAGTVLQLGEGNKLLLHIW